MIEGCRGVLDNFYQLKYALVLGSRKLFLGKEDDPRFTAESLDSRDRADATEIAHDLNCGKANGDKRDGSLRASHRRTFIFPRSKQN